MKNRDRIITGILIISGVFLRCYHLFRVDIVDQPFRLGGLFVEFSTMIAQNGFRLPANIPYFSDGGLPFAYPPLSFYVEAILLKIFPSQQFLIANLLPPLVAILTFLLATLLLKIIFNTQPWHFLAALFACAFLTSTFSNQIEAAGLAESFGSLALVVFLWAAIQFNNRPGWKTAILEGFALGLCILSSPGTAVGGPFLAIIFAIEYLTKNRVNPQNFALVMLIAVTGMVVSAPYWMTVMVNYGPNIFISPIQGQYSRNTKSGYLVSLIFQVLDFSVTAGGWPFFWNVTIFLGMLWLVFHGKFTWPVVFLALFSIPRENIWMIGLPSAILFAYGVVDFIASVNNRSNKSQPWRKIATISAIILVAGWAVYQSFDLVNSAIVDKQELLTKEQIHTIQKARNMLPTEAKVVVIGNAALMEWSPFLLEHEVINNTFGLEWKPVQLGLVDALNSEISDAQSWDDVLKAVIEKTGYKQVYILSQEKKHLSFLGKNSTVRFQLKIETDNIQLGLLNPPNK